MDQAEELWYANKNQYPPNQILQTETLHTDTQTFKMCRICGDENNINSITVLTSDNRRVKGIHCNDCIEIQKGKGVNYIKIKEIS